MSGAAKKLAMTESALQASLAADVIAKVKVVDGIPGEALPDNSNVIMTSAGFNPTQVVESVLQANALHLCQTDGDCLTDELNASAIMLTDPHRFLNFPVSTILSPLESGAESEKKLTMIEGRFQKAKEKPAMLANIRAHLENLKKNESVISDVGLIADEMFTNAVFNAPFVDPKTGHNPGIDRDDETVQMSAQNFGDFKVGYNDNRIVIVCKDPYGSLQIKKFLQRIYKCCTSGLSQSIHMGAGGAGIGSYMVFNASSSLYLGVISNKMTIVAAVIQWKWSSRKRSEAARNIHLFQL